jgi:UDP-N-acetyl-D-glucosamine dehydrogenase
VGVKVAIVGQGYVGLPLAMAATTGGHHVLGIDSETTKVELLKKGISPIGDISNSQISNARDKYRASSHFSEISDKQIVILCVPTPLDTNGSPDLAPLTSALNSVAEYFSENTLIIIESTISPGTTKGLVKDILDKAGKRYFLAYSPERVNPANKEWGVTNTPKLVAGLDERATNLAADFYKTFIKDVVIASSVEVVETAKLLENSFRLINISFVNEFAQFCQKLGVDVREVIAAAATKPYGFMPFSPGAGVGGHCIPVDPNYLVAKAKEIGAPTKFIDLANEINQSLGNYFANIAESNIGNLSGKKIILVGVAYKPNVADTRETPALGIYEALRAKGAVVSYNDPIIPVWNGTNSVPLSPDFDLAILVNPHTGMDLKKLENLKVIDTRGGY